MKRKYTTDELAQLFDKKDWDTLWKIVTPMVKHAVKRCMQEGLDPYYVRDDLMQEAYLAAWEALPRWNAFEAGLQTWVMEKVRSAVLDNNRREQSGMIGGRDNGAYVVSMHGDTALEDTTTDDEQRTSRTVERKLAYKESPEGFGDPSEEIDDPVTDLISQTPPKYRDMVRRLCGIGTPQETQEQYALTEGLSLRAVEMRLMRLRRKNLCGFSRKLANHVTRGTKSQRKIA